MCHVLRPEDEYGNVQLWEMQVPTNNSVFLANSKSSARSASAAPGCAIYPVLIISLKAVANYGSAEPILDFAKVCILLVGVRAFDHCLIMVGGGGGEQRGFVS